MNEYLRAMDELAGTSSRAQVMAHAREIQQYLDTHQELEDDEVTELVDDLNHQWPYRGHTVLFSGNVRLFCDSASYYGQGRFELSEDEFIEEMVTDLRVTSHGFSHVTSDQQRREVVHKLILENENGEGIEGYGGITHAHLIPETKSDADCIADALLFLDDEIEQIDEMILNATGETAAIKALRQLTLRPTSDQLLQLGEDGYRDGLSAYLNQLITFDKRVPYRVTLQDDCRLYAKDNSIAVPLRQMPRERRLVYPQRLYIDALATNSEEYVPYMETIVLFDREDENRVTFPLRSLQGIVGIREQELGVIARHATQYGNRRKA